MGQGEMLTAAVEGQERDLVVCTEGHTPLAWVPRGLRVFMYICMFLCIDYIHV